MHGGGQEVRLSVEIKCRSVWQVTVSQKGELTSLLFEASNPQR